jgi:hypothetical protein
VLFGLGAAHGYGVADFAATNGVHRFGLVRAVMITQLFGLVGIAGVITAIGGRPGGSASDWLALGADRGYTPTTAALTSLYRGVTILLAWTFLRERLQPA